MSTGQIETIAAQKAAGQRTSNDAVLEAEKGIEGEEQKGAEPQEAKPVITYLLLIRHGENDWVATHRLAGRTPEVHLNDKGKQQAQAIVSFLRNQPIKAIYSSPLERCLETAQPLADELKVPLESEVGLIEVEYGEWRGADLRELSKLPEWRLVQHYPSSFRFPAGETLYEVQARAAQTLETIRSRHAGQLVACFSHGDVIRLAVAHYMGIPIDLFQRVQISTASTSVIAFHNSVPSVVGVNYQTSLPLFETKQEK